MQIRDLHPSVFYWVNGAAGGEGGGGGWGVWSQSQLTLDMRSNHQLVKGLTFRDKQTFARSFTPEGSSETPGARARRWSVGGQRTQTEAVQTGKNMQTTQKKLSGPTKTCCQSCF